MCAFTAGQSKHMEGKSQRSAVIQGDLSKPMQQQDTDVW